MGKLKSVIGYSWTAAAIIVFAAMVMLSQQPEAELNSFFVLRVSDRVSGGEVSGIIQHERYQTIIRKPVFEGIFADRKDGFVQVEWKADGGAIPDRIDETIDYNGDGKNDFTVRYDTKTGEVSLEKHNPEVKGSDSYMTFSSGDTKGLRIPLVKQ